MNIAKLQKIYRRIFWAGYIAVIVAATLPFFGNLDKTRVELVLFEIRLDHLLHFFAYFIISMYYVGGRILEMDLFNRRSLVKFLTVTVLLATVTEVIQLWVPSRAFNIFDWLSNVTGIFAGIFIGFGKVLNIKR